MDGEISIEHYSCLRKDRNRSGGGVACFIHKSIGFEERSDFSDDFVVAPSAHESRCTDFITN